MRRLIDHTERTINRVRARCSNLQHPPPLQKDLVNHPPAKPLSLPTILSSFVSVCPSKHSVLEFHQPFPERFPSRVPIKRSREKASDARDFAPVTSHGERPRFEFAHCAQHRQVDRIDMSRGRLVWL